MSDPVRIVLADDHPIFRRGLREVLEQQSDFKVVAECGDGEEALAAIERERPTIAVLDVGMPKQDGFAVVRALSEKGDSTRLVLLTMHARDDVLREAFSLEVRAYVVKEAAVVDVVHIGTDLQRQSALVGRELKIASRPALQRLEDRILRQACWCTHQQKKSNQACTNAYQENQHLCRDGLEN